MEGTTGDSRSRRFTRNGKLESEKGKGKGAGEGEARAKWKVEGLRYAIRYIKSYAHFSV
jgi:hypothetical protein